MDLVVMSTSILRSFLVGVVYGVNVSGLKILSVEGRRCSHGLTTGMVLVIGLVYNTTWALSLGFHDGQWITPMWTTHSHCVLQRTVTSEATALLVALLVARLIVSLFAPLMKSVAVSRSAVVLLICILWLGPQMMADIASIFASRVDRDSNIVPNFIQIPSWTNSSVVYRLGMMVCVRHLNQQTLDYFKWQYFMIIIPLMVIIAISVMVPRRKRSKDYLFEGLDSKTEDCTSSCVGEFIVDIALGFNFLWLILMRPLAMIHALCLPSHDPSQALFIDIGSHLVLSCSTIFSPFAAIFSKTLHRHTDVA